MTFQFRPYQLEAIERALTFDGFGLWLEQRTGKTPVTVRIAKRRKPNIFFIVCPKGARGVWEKALEEHWVDREAKVHLVHYERLLINKVFWRREFRKWKKAGLKVLMAVDEAHRIKKRGSQQSRLIRSLGKLVTWRLALTGTPIAQGIHDAWALFNFLDPTIFGPYSVHFKVQKKRQKQGLPPLPNFQDRFLLLGGFRNLKPTGYRNEEEFYEIFHRYSARKTLNEARIESGKKSIQIRRRKLFVKIGEDARFHYQELEKELRTVVRKIEIKTPLVLTLTMKLQQLAGGFLLTETGRALRIDDAKLSAFQGYIQGLTSKQRFVVCARFTHEIAAISQILDALGITYQVIAGGKKHEEFEEFTERAAILQIQKAEAIDLSLASIYIFFSWNYSYINHEQSRFRILSFDKDFATYVYLIANDTVDELIYEAVVQKKDLATLVCDRYRRKRETGKASRVHKGGAVKAHS